MISSVKQLLKRLTAYWEFFCIQFQALPPALIRRCVKHVVISLCTVAISCAMLFCFRAAVFASGFLFALYLCWPVYTITKGYYEGTVYGLDMVFLKKNKPLKFGERCILHFKTVSTPEQFFSFYMHLTAKQQQWFSEGMILTVYLNQNNPMEILEWDLKEMV